MSRVTRRSFLGGSLGALGAGFAIGGTKSSGKIIGANETVRIGIAGLNGRGKSHMGAFAGMEGVEIAYLIDPDTRTYGSSLKLVDAKSKGGSKPRTAQDIRTVLDDKDVDAITVATPNHWHALITIWACQADKDVYVEKPASHNVHEGRIAVETARKHKRIVQHGTQSRSSPEWKQVVELAQSGKFGKLLVSRGLCYKPRKSIGIKPNTDAPPEIDFNIWLGPAEKEPFNTNLVHYNWHWFWPFGNGDIGNQGVHQMDIARWIAGVTLPRSVVGLGGRFGYQDQGETPNTELVFFDYGPGQPQVVFEVRGLETGAFKGQKVGNIAHFEEGTISGGGKFLFTPKGSTDSQAVPGLVEKPKGGDGEGGHFGNFIAAVRSRRQDELNADILEGHYSAALCHLGNISYQLGDQVPFNSKTKAFGDNKVAYEALERMEQHLAKDNGLKLDGMQYQLGKKLTFNAQAESFDDPEANKMLTRAYRAPFVVPDRAI